MACCTRRWSRSTRSSTQTIISRIKVMSELDISEKRVPQDGRFKVRIKGRTIDFRVSIMPSVHGEECVIRILDKESMNEEFKPQLSLDVLWLRRARTIKPAAPLHQGAVRHGTGHRSHRLGQDDDALRLPCRRSATRGQDHHHRGSGGVPAQGHHPDPGQREEGADVRPRVCARSCGTIRTRSWSARSATPRRHRSPFSRR